MTAEAERAAEMARMALAEIDPQVTVAWRTGKFKGGLTWTISCDREPGGKAMRLTLLRMEGPDRLVRCDLHTRRGTTCAGIPVAWALLGHTCEGRA